MIQAKNIFVGFLVSFIGSIPLGYLNVIGYEIYTKKGFSSTVEYLLGVVIIEAIVIYTTLIFADVITKQVKWLKRIELFTILFLLVLGVSFFISQKDSSAEAKSIYTEYLPFVTGIILSSLNFIQIPFWTGWNIYLINNNYISTFKFNRFFYISGTLFGTFFGMLFLIFGLHYFAQNSSYVDGKIISKLFPILFFGMAIIQVFKFYKKYYSNKT